ncbi:MAG: site-specific DNA-methyltransferase [Nitrosospira sp.]|nr:site-specific DNA-methyltransferase [Nitrosospira sp.]
MQKLTAQDAEAKSTDFKAENIAQLKALFPELLTENAKGVAINVDVLKQLVGDVTVTDTEEKYGLSWHGKRRARQIALSPSTGTLRPFPEESLDWDTTQNLMIEGDNLEVLKLLQKSYAGEVKLIYIDPPYNTGKDFVYPDNFQDNIKNYLELTGQVENGRKISSNTEASGRFHTDWLNMMYPRLKLARNLLGHNGALLVSIGDMEIVNLLPLMNDIFGEENQIGIFTWKSRAKPTNAGDAKLRTQRVAEYIVAYGRKPGDELLLNVVSSKTRTYPHQDTDGKYRTTTILTSNRGMFRRETMRFEAGGYKPDEDSRWKAGKTVIEDLIIRNRIVFNDHGVPMEKKYEIEEKDPLYPIYSFLDPDLCGTAENGKNDLNALVGNQHGLDTVKPVQLLKYLIATFSNQHDIVMDFFAGSGTTGHAVGELNSDESASRKFILVQFPERMDNGTFSTISELTKERLRRAAKKIRDDNPVFSGDTGFRVFKLDTSNIRAWNPNRDNLAQSLLDNEEHIMPGRTESDMVYELLLKLGLDLCVPIEARSIAGKTVSAIGEGVLMTCLAEKITPDDVEALAQGIVTWRKELAPAGDTTCVFRDSAFENDIAKSNLAAILEQYGIANVRSL